jgi:protease-4
MSAEEISYLQKYIDRGYSLFRKRVADGRKMTIDQVEAVAQGHVFLGQDAIKLKLVDELGGIDKAITKAASLAKLSEYHTAYYPDVPDFLEQLLEQTEKGSGSYLDSKIRATLGDFYEPYFMLKTLNKQSAIQARLPFFPNIH